MPFGMDEPKYRFTVADAEVLRAAKETTSISGFKV